MLTRPVGSTFDMLKGTVVDGGMASMFHHLPQIYMWKL